MSQDVSAALRRLVLRRAGGLCEYCLLHQEDAHFSFHVDHIVSRRHRGASSAGNLALACLRCNVAKGADLGTLAGRPRQLIALYHPRRDRWDVHFRLNGIRIMPLTATGEATVRLLELNADDRLRLRRALHKSGRYPSPEALSFLRRA